MTSQTRACCRIQGSCTPGRRQHLGKALHVRWIVSEVTAAGSDPVEAWGANTEGRKLRQEETRLGGWEVEGRLHPDVQNPNLTLPILGAVGKAGIACLIRLAMIWGFRNGWLNAPSNGSAWPERFPHVHPCGFRDLGGPSQRTAEATPQRLPSARCQAHPASLIQPAGARLLRSTPIGDSAEAEASPVSTTPSPTVTHHQRARAPRVNLYKRRPLPRHRAVATILGWPKGRSARGTHHFDSPKQFSTTWKARSIGIIRRRRRKASQNCGLINRQHPPWRRPGRQDGFPLRPPSSSTKKMAETSTGSAPASSAHIEQAAR